MGRELGNLPCRDRSGNGNRYGNENGEKEGGWGESSGICHVVIESEQRTQRSGAYEQPLASASRSDARASTSYNHQLFESRGTENHGQTAASAEPRFYATTVLLCTVIEP